jgi:xanthine/uracil permease
MVSGAAGGTGVTTYAENIGVMAATRIYSTAVFMVAALMALVLGFSPKFGALIQAIPLPVMGGVSIVVFGLITMAGAKIWVDNKVDFTDPANLLVAAITLVLGTGDFTLKFGSFALGGIGTATFGAGQVTLSRKAEDGFLHREQELLLPIAHKASVCGWVEIQLAANGEGRSGQKLGVAHFSQMLL